MNSLLIRPLTTNYLLSKVAQHCRPHRELSIVLAHTLFWYFGDKCGKCCLSVWEERAWTMSLFNENKKWRWQHSWPSALEKKVFSLFLFCFFRFFSEMQWMRMCLCDCVCVHTHVCVGKCVPHFILLIPAHLSPRNAEMDVSYENISECFQHKSFSFDWMRQHIGPQF